MKIKVENQEDFLKRAFFLAYRAIPGTTGMGVFQAKNDATEEDIWEHVFVPDHDHIYGDYVFGRMMKWGVKIEDGIINATNDEFRQDYQGFTWTYKDNKALFDATAKSLHCEYEIVK